MLEIFDQLRNQTFGCGEDTSEEMYAMLIDFVNKWVSVSLKNPRTRRLCLDLQAHTCSKRYCLKCRKTCRFRYPKFPILDTIVAVPAVIKYPDQEICDEKVKLSKEILKSVKAILDQEDIMKNIVNEVAQGELEDMFELEENICLLEDIIEFYSVPLGKGIVTEYSQKHKIKVCELYEWIFETTKHWPLTGFCIGEESPENELTIQDMKGLLNVLKGMEGFENHNDKKKNIEKERLGILLDLAQVPGENFDERYKLYKEALSITHRGYEIVLRRDTDEIYINNYNEEYLIAWDSNIDIQVTLDYFAVITYITDYKMKDESGTLEHIKRALKEDNSETLKEQLKHVAHTFITHRKAGESEILYKMFPFLCFTNSNITAVWMPTGFKNNMCRFLRTVSDEEAQNLENVVIHNGKPHQETFNLYDKFLQKPDEIPIVYAQFVQRYKAGMDPSLENYSVIQEFYDYTTEIRFSEEHTDSEKKTKVKSRLLEENYQKKLKPRTTALKHILDDDFIFEHEGNKKKKRLPRYIPLKNGQWMQLRSKCVVRFHKINQTKDPHEFYFSEMQKYLPFLTEAELFPDDFDRCLEKYNQSQVQIAYVKSFVFPHMDNVQKGREQAETLDANLGTILDPLGAVDDFVAREEGATEDPELQILNPENCNAAEDSKFTSIGDRTFRKIEVQTEDILLEKVQGLDPEQRGAVEEINEYARKVKMFEMRPSDNARPKPILLLVHGNAGTGKSHVIDIASQLAHKTFAFNSSGHDPDHPYILKLAFTGSAADLIGGQTIHKALGLPCNNSAVPLGDKMRDLRRIQLKELKMIFIDEISLVGADTIYQIHFRLSKEIKQNCKDFGGCAMVFFGDQLQIKPVSNTFNFGVPTNPKFAMADSINRLWDKFQRIELKTNHRSGKFREYAEILNNLRIGQLTTGDIEKLESRVFPRNSKDMPSDAIFVSGENAIVNEYNKKKLNELDTELVSRKANVFSATQKEIKSPKLDSSGYIHKTNIPLVVDLKVRARVTLTYNIDVSDSLCNGSLGEVVGFKRDNNNVIKYVMVKFDKLSAGSERRKKFKFLESEFGDATPIDLLEQEYHQGKESSSSATAINWPLKLAWGITLHKIQGTTVFHPRALICDYDCWLKPSMVYVGNSRIQALSQLYILEKKTCRGMGKNYNNYPVGSKLPLNKMVPWPEAMEELERQEDIAPTLLPQKAPNDCIKLISLNIRSLRAHLNDLQHDSYINGNFLLVQETNLPQDVLEGFDLLPSYQCKLNSFGNGRGIGSYYKQNKLDFIINVRDNNFQVTVLEIESLYVYNVYRSQNAGTCFMNKLKGLFDTNNNIQKSHIIMGDWNFCIRSEPNHPVRSFLESQGFVEVNQLLQQTPLPTHLRGRTIDHAWFKGSLKTITIQSLSVRSCVYSDHEKIELVKNRK